MSQRGGRAPGNFFKVVCEARSAPAMQSKGAQATCMPGPLRGYVGEVTLTSYPKRNFKT